MRPVFLAAVTAGMLSVVGVSPASAHAGLMPGALPPNTTEEAELVLVHGCGPGGTIPTSDEETLATTAVTLEAPDGVSLVARDRDGWQLSTETGADGRLSGARWDLIADGGTLETVVLGLEVTVADLPDGTEIWLPVVQECVDGERLTWTNEEPDEGDGPLPAMRLTIDSASGATEPVGGGLPTGVIVTLAVALAVAVAGAVFVVSGRRA